MPLRPLLNRGDLPAIRAALGLDPAQMSQRIGLSRKHYEDLEAGHALLSPVLQNAIRWVEHTRGEPPPDVCRACDGQGTYRRPGLRGQPGGHARRERCDHCDGEGVARVNASDAPASP